MVQWVQCIWTALGSKKDWLYFKSYAVFIMWLALKLSVAHQVLWKHSLSLKTHLHRWYPGYVDSLLGWCSRTHLDVLQRMQTNMSK